MGILKLTDTLPFGKFKGISVKLLYSFKKIIMEKLYILYNKDNSKEIVRIISEVKYKSDIDYEEKFRNKFKKYITDSLFKNCCKLDLLCSEAIEKWETYISGEKYVLVENINQIKTYKTVNIKYLKYSIYNSLKLWNN
jgi:hypothetical protein